MARKPIEIQLKVLLDEYDESVRDVVSKVAKEVANEGANSLRSSSPKKTGEYAKGWRSRKTPYGYRIHNVNKPGLTHLLEHGHLIRNQKGTYGRTKAIKHIEPVEKWINDEFETRIKKGIEGVK